MKIIKLGLFLSFSLGLIFFVNAQLLNYSAPIKKSNDLDFSNFSMILYNGSPWVNKDTPDGALLLASDMKGTLSVSSVDRTGKQPKILEAIGFKIGIKNYHSNALYLYSDETFSEVNIADLFEECKNGDKLFLMVVDKKYQLPRHEIVVMDGC